MKQRDPKLTTPQLTLKLLPFISKLLLEKKRQFEPRFKISNDHCHRISFALQESMGFIMTKQIFFFNLKH